MEVTERSQRRWTVVCCPVLGLPAQVMFPGVDDDLLGGSDRLAARWRPRVGRRLVLRFFGGCGQSAVRAAKERNCPEAMPGGSAAESPPDGETEGAKQPKAAGDGQRKGNLEDPAAKPETGRPTKCGPRSPSSPRPTSPPWRRPRPQYARLQHR